MATLLVDPPFERSVWFSKKLEDFKNDVVFNNYLFAYGRAATLGNPNRMGELIVASGQQLHDLQTPESLTNLVNYVGGLDQSLSSLEDRLIALLYAVYIRRNHPETWPDGDKHVWKLGCNTALLLVHWVNQHYMEGSWTQKPLPR